MTSREQYLKAIEVLDRVGGMYQGVGRDEMSLLVNEAQYKALVEAGVVNSNETKQDQRSGKKSRKVK
jgi:hypothetical protein